MSIFQALDATQLAARSSAALADPAAWAAGAPLVARPRVRASVHAAESYSWWTLARNPHAMVVTGMIATVMAKDALLAANKALLGARAS